MGGEASNFDMQCLFHTNRRMFNDWNRFSSVTTSQLELILRKMPNEKALISAVQTQSEKLLSRYEKEKRSVKVSVSEGDSQQATGDEANVELRSAIAASGQTPPTPEVN